MAIEFADLKKRSGDGPPRIMIYGPEKAGKTTLASEFPNPVFLQTEEGTGILELNSFGLLTTFKDVNDAIDALLENDHNYGTVVIDSLSALEKIVWTETGQRGDEKGNKRTRIEDFGYGRGYKFALNTWMELFNKLMKLRRERGMAIVLIAHSITERFNDPETDSYSKYEIDLHQLASAFWKRECDAIILLKPDVVIKSEDQGFNKTRTRADGGRSVWMNTTSRPAFVAGNRYKMPEKILYEIGKGFDAMAPYLLATQAETGGVVEQEPQREAAE